MIKSFRNKATQAIFETGFAKGFHPNLCKIAVRKLDMLNRAKKPEDMRAPPGNKLHPLKRDREGEWAIWINDQFRLCFRFDGEDAIDVEITDYH